MPCDNRDRMIRGPIPRTDQWHEIRVEDTYHYLDDMWDWTEPNTTDSFIQLGSTWMFVSREDFMMFSLRWL